MSTIKYRYALDVDGTVAYVNQLAPQDRRDYECLSCRQPLRPVLGSIRQKHFRHQVDIDCSEETYLHRLGKTLFRQTYQSCLDRDEPFVLEYYQPKVCTYCEKHGPCQLPPVLVRYDLTRAFRYIAMETQDCGLIPDLMLITDAGEKLYVEIAVTHQVTDDKRNSGQRIIELSVMCEEDLAPIQQHLISENDSRVECMNFAPREIRGPFKEECKEWLDVFFLWPSGKSKIVSLRPPSLLDDIRVKKCYWRVVPHPGPDTYLMELERAYTAGYGVKNCFLCRYHAQTTLYQWELSNKPVFCKFLKTTRDSNDAAECQYYRPDRAVFRYS